MVGGKFLMVYKFHQNLVFKILSLEKLWSILLIIDWWWSKVLLTVSFDFSLDEPYFSVSELTDGKFYINIL